MPPWPGATGSRSRNACEKAGAFPDPASALSRSFVQRDGARAIAEVEIACSEREAAVWRERLDTAVTLLLERLEAGPRDRFLALQRSWEGYAAQRCTLAGDVHSSAPSTLAQARCDLGEIASRAIKIERLSRSPNPGSQLTR